MMGFDIFDFVLSLIIFFVYGSIFIISMIFTFSLEAYRKIDDKLNLDIIQRRILSPLEINIDWIDAWLMKNNKIIGPLLILLSMVDLKLFLDIIKHLNS